MTMKINLNWEARLISMTYTKEEEDERRKNNLRGKKKNQRKLWKTQRQTNEVLRDS